MRSKTYKRKTAGESVRRSERDIAYIDLLEKEVTMQESLLNRIFDGLASPETIVNMDLIYKEWVNEREEIDRAVQSWRLEMEEDFGDIGSMALDKVSMRLNYLMIFMGALMIILGCLDFCLEGSALWLIGGGVLSIGFGIWCCFEERKWASWDNI